MKYAEGEKHKDLISKREGQKFYFDGENVEIVVLRKNPDEEVIKMIAENEIFFQLFLREEIVFLLIKVDGLKWIDIPFVIEKSTKLKHPDDINRNYFANIIFADCVNGKVCAARTQTLGHGLSKALFWALKKQLEYPIENIRQKINKVHAGFSSDEMARLSLGK